MENDAFELETDLSPYRMPTDVLMEIDELSDERRSLLLELSRTDAQSNIRARLQQIDQELDHLWTVRRAELSHAE